MFEAPTVEQPPIEDEDEKEKEESSSENQKENEGSSIINLEEIPEGFDLESAMNMIEKSSNIPESVKESILEDIKELNPWSETSEAVSEFSVTKNDGELVVNVTWDKKYPGGGPTPGSSSESGGWLWKNSSMGYSLEEAKSE